MKFNIFCKQERCLNMMLILVTFLGFWAKTQGRGGLTPKGKITKPAHYVF